MGHRSIAALSALVTLSLLGAACGDDDETSTSETSAAAPATAAGGDATTTAADAATTTAAEGATTTAGADTNSAAAPTRSEIKIGYALALSGFGSGTKHTADVAKAWAAWVNESQGGVDGHPVTIVIGDTKSDPASAQAAVTNLVESEKVAAVMYSDSATEVAVSEYLAQQGVPVVGTTVYNPTITLALPNYFNHVTSYPAVVQEQNLAAQAVGATKFTAAVCAESPACESSTAVNEATAGELGQEYAGFVKVAASAPDYTAECVKFVQDGDDFVQLSSAFAVGGRIAEDCMDQGYEGWFGASAGTVQAPEFEKVDGLRIAGGLQAFPWFADAEPVAQFRDVMEQYAPDVDYRDATSSSTWSALELFRKAMIDTPDEVTPADVMAAYGAIKDETLDGLLPQPITFTAGQPSPPVSCFWLYSYEEGEFTLTTQGESGNGASGDLQSSCYPVK